jgi:hypothetical protein
MRKIYLLLGLLLALTSCVNSTTRQRQEQEQETNQKATLPIADFVEKFLFNHKNFNNNEITREQADKDFLAEFKAASDSINLIEGIPVQLEALNDFGNGKVMAQFRAWITPHSYKFPFPINDVNFDVVCQIDERYVTTLNDKAYYVLHGKLKECVDFDTFEKLLGKRNSIYTPLFQVRKSDFHDGSVVVSLGIMHYDVDSITNFTME